MNFLWEFGAYVKANFDSIIYLVALVALYFFVSRFFWSAAVVMPPALRRGVRLLIVAVSVSALLLLVAYITISTMPDSNMEITAQRALSVADSVFSGIVSFILLGAFAFIASLRRPQEESISERISYLYSARFDDDKGVRDYVTSQLMTLGASIRKSEVSYRFTDFDGVNCALKVNTIVSMTIVNMMKHDTYRQKLPVNISFHPVPGKESQSGRILRIETTKISSSGVYSKVKRHLDHPCNIDPLPGGYSSHVDLEIPPDGRLVYLYEYEGWIKKDDNFWTGVNRFASEVVISASNLTDFDISITRNKSGHKRVKFKDIASDSVCGKGVVSHEVHVEHNLEPGCPLTFSVSVVLPCANDQGLGQGLQQKGGVMYRDNETSGG